MKSKMKNKKEKTDKKHETLVFRMGHNKMIRISLALPVTLYEDLRKAFEKENMTQSDYVRLAIRRAVNETLANQLSLV